MFVRQDASQVFCLRLAATTMVDSRQLTPWFVNLNTNLNANILAFEVSQTETSPVRLRLLVNTYKMLRLNQPFQFDFQLNYTTQPPFFLNRTFCFRAPTSDPSTTTDAVVCNMPYLLYCLDPPSPSKPYVVVDTRSKQLDWSGSYASWFAVQSSADVLRQRCRETQCRAVSVQLNPMFDAQHDANVLGDCGCCNQEGGGGGNGGKMWMRDFAIVLICGIVATLIGAVVFTYTCQTPQGDDNFSSFKMFELFSSSKEKKDIKASTHTDTCQQSNLLPKQLEKLNYFQTVYPEVFFEVVLKGLKNECESNTNFIQVDNEILDAVEILQVANFDKTNITNQVGQHLKKIKNTQFFKNNFATGSKPPPPCFWDYLDLKIKQKLLPDNQSKLLAELAREIVCKDAEQRYKKYIEPVTFESFDDIELLNVLNDSELNLNDSELNLKDEDLKPYIETYLQCIFEQIPASKDSANMCGCHFQTLCDMDTIIKGSQKSGFTIKLINTRYEFKRRLNQYMDKCFSVLSKYVKNTCKSCLGILPLYFVSRLLMSFYQHQVSILYDGELDVDPTFRCPGDVGETPSSEVKETPSSDAEETSSDEESVIRAPSDYSDFDNGSENENLENENLENENLSIYKLSTTFNTDINVSNGFKHILSLILYSKNLFLLQTESTNTKLTKCVSAKYRNLPNYNSSVGEMLLKLAAVGTAAAVFTAIDSYFGYTMSHYLGTAASNQAVAAINPFSGFSLSSYLGLVAAQAAVPFVANQLKR